MLALVVDDSRAVRMMLTRMLTECGFDGVAEAGHGLEALERLAEGPLPDVMLVDWNMPEMNGIELIRAVRSTPAYRAIPVVMVTTETEASQVDRALADDPQIEVVGTAANGKLALPMVSLLRPDLVTLDIEMPEMDGLEALPHIRRIDPRVPVVMFSSLSTPGAAATLDALAAGATDFCTKPSNLNGLADGVEAVKSQLLPKVRALCGLGTARLAALVGATLRPAAPAPAWRPARRIGAAAVAARVEAVVIAVSTGGPTALRAVWSALPASLAVPVLVVQHMPPTFTTLLAQRLHDADRLPTAEATDGAPVRPGHAWLAPSDHHMTVRREGASIRVRLDQGPPESSCRPAADPLFRSAAAVWGPGVLAVVLTGMGSDGLRGAEAIVAAGGRVIAQDQATSVVWGMPGQIVHAGIADAVVPLAAVASTIVARVNAHGRARHELEVGA